MRTTKHGLILFLLVAMSACGTPRRAKAPESAPPTIATPAQQASVPPTVSVPKAVPASPSQPPLAATDALSLAQQKIKHIVIIMQENRSFDEYFGTYPGADGIPMQNGVPTVCVNDPQTKQCVKPYHNPQDINAGGPHASASARADIAGGKMNGFIAQFRQAQRDCTSPDAPGCAKGATPDVMGWHDAREIPNYWTYAQDFVLQDHMFEPNASWSLPAHLFMVSAWSAECKSINDPESCTDALDGPTVPGLPGTALVQADQGKLQYAWTDLTYLLYKNNISWAYYLSEGNEPDCSNDAMICPP